MTKGQTEFVISVLVVLTGIGVASHMLYKSHHAITATKTATAITTCDVVKDIHIGMTKDEVYTACGAAERIDDSSVQVKTVEKVFKHDEIWYYDQQKQTVELTNDVVTAVHGTIPAALPKAK